MKRENRDYLLFLAAGLQCSVEICLFLFSKKKERFSLCKIGKNRDSFDTKLEQENIYF